MVRLKTLGSRVKESAGSRLKVITPGSWRSDKTSTQRGYGYKWQKARERYLLDHPLCVYCARHGVTAAASVVDHKIPHRGDQDLFWDESNWQPLCKPCHDSVKQAEEAAGLAG
ncbi:HNH endonuclease [Pseudomonas chlororaphis]|uniref:HNH endonuclease n=1 Tax=Pseudomonas chlororaphis TaxID=587753 RepID=UPI001B316BFD|nr:HNH endonuclease signature motif containing protein [Pseudomonas chlororaphis]MBP5058926.1 HNH endonuclease [Pseudomonas chlororaphis]MBP5140298.1 HNH endonuclease [Pseudomonas chlororaphis]QTT99507.1 HNH endonuclease [Pseudomonas chlororaphis]